MKERWDRFYRSYVRFVERQGFLVILAVCVGVITTTAIWTKQADTGHVAPTSPVDQAAAAAQLQQQSLADAATPTPMPTPAPPTFCPPLEKVSVIRAFDGARLVRSEVTGLWQMHDAADLQADVGTPVVAMAPGTVVDRAEEGIWGAWVRIDHGSGVEAWYAGMKALTAIQPGDPVDQGQTLGFVGNCMVDETDLPPHLHLRVTRNGQAFDPSTLW